MKRAHDGGPAFPVAHYDHQTFEPETVGDALRLMSGMSLRDYFIAHAPAEPQLWFEPVMPAEPVVPKWKSEKGELRDELRDYFEDDSDVYSDAAHRWLDNYVKVDKLHDEWVKDCRKQRYIQWPGAWADAQLAERERFLAAQQEGSK